MAPIADLCSRCNDPFIPVPKKTAKAITGLAVVAHRALQEPALSAWHCRTADNFQILLILLAPKVTRYIKTDIPYIILEYGERITQTATGTPHRVGAAVVVR